MFSVNFENDTKTFFPKQVGAFGNLFHDESKNSFGSSSKNQTKKLLLSFELPKGEVELGMIKTDNRFVGANLRLFIMLVKFC